MNKKTKKARTRGRRKGGRGALGKVVLAYNSREVLHGDRQVEEMGDSGDRACGPGGWHGLPLHPAVPPPPLHHPVHPPSCSIQPCSISPTEPRGSLPSPSSPPQHHRGCLNPAFGFFFQKEGKRSAFGAPPHPSLIPRFLSAKEGTPPPSSKHAPLGLRGSLLAKKKTLGGHPVLPPRGQSILAGCLVAVVVGMPSPGTLQRHPTSDGEEPSPELVLPLILAPPVLGPPSSSLSSPKSLRPSLGDALAASSPKDWPHPSDGSRCVF